ncbi:MAG: sigma 54-interacting transcriptional regulator [Planctomycetaceae bacterium]|nr:sigma 54-interacting transcriptional regulator [Planctomycetaceae bacterium]
MPRSSKSSEPNSERPASAAYLIVRDGDKWQDMFRLTPGQVMTIGRAPTNRIVVRSEQSSRNHCEVFQAGPMWILRDLGSRNGTTVDGHRIAGDWELEEGQTIQLGACEITFTHELADKAKAADDSDDAEIESATQTQDVIPAKGPKSSEPEIVSRKKRTRYSPTSTAEHAGDDRFSQNLAQLWKLAVEMGSAKDEKQLSEVVLDGLLAAIGADIGAVLMLPKPMSGGARPTQLRVVAYKSQGEHSYQTISKALSRMVLDDREAVLAKNVADDSKLSDRDSLDEIEAKSVICAPIRNGDSIYGLIHLYSTLSDESLEPEHLEFTLAVADQMALAFENIREKQSLAEGLARAQNENESLRNQLAIDTELIGNSPEMQQLKQQIGRIAPTDATVLIRGESGVGKELVARAVHFGSDRRNGPFICLNCAALSETLLESELFGHEKGSFTGATGRKLGKFEQAHRGSLFLDEVGEMSLSIQAKFLRVLEGHPFERVGGSSPINVDVRVIAATNRNLEEAIHEKLFRKDLYFRLFVVEVSPAPLREHRSDIPVLASYFLHRFAKKTGRPARGFTDEALEVLCQFDWPGNVRELQNCVERAVVMSTGEMVSASEIKLSGLRPVVSDTAPPIKAQLPSIATESPLHSAGQAANSEKSLEALEQEHILATLEKTNWNKSQSATILGIERSTLDRKLKRYGVNRPE